MGISQDDNYAGVYDNMLGYGERPALILIDFVEAYFQPENDLYADPQSALDAALILRKLAHQQNIPVIITNVVYDANGITGGVFFKKTKPLRNFVPGAEHNGWPAGLEPGPNDIVVSKQYPSAFFGTSLSSTLTAAGIDTVILTGLTTSGCVRATCVDASSYGFRPMIVEEACGDRHADPHNANLFDMNAKYGDVVSLENASEYLKGINI